jgi:hypothetical protein
MWLLFPWVIILKSVLVQYTSYSWQSSYWNVPYIVLSPWYNSLSIAHKIWVYLDDSYLCLLKNTKYTLLLKLLLNIFHRHTFWFQGKQISSAYFWINNYLCNQCISQLKLWVRALLMARLTDTTLCDKVCQWLAAGRWLSPVTQLSSTNKTDRHGIAEILLKVELYTINQPTHCTYIENVDILFSAHDAFLE